MYRGIIAAALVFWPLSSLAGEPDHEIVITSPSVAECVNNGDDIITGGIAGGELLVDGRDVPVTFTARSPDGKDLNLTFLTEWSEVLPNGTG